MSTTAVIEQHLYGSTRTGLDPKHLPGFQHIAISSGLQPGPDLDALEGTSFYALPRELDPALAPLRETVLPLPSGRWAVGRCWPCGVDAQGRAGNFRAHHLVLDYAALLAFGGPFALLDAWPRPADPLAVDSQPLVPLRLRVPAATPEPGLADLPPDWLPHLVEAACAQPFEPLLVVGPTPAARQALGLIWELAARLERPVAVATHAYRAEHLSDRFQVVAVAEHGWAPRGAGSRQVDLTVASPSPVSSSALGDWLIAALRHGGWPAARSGLASLAAVRRGDWVPQQVEAPDLLRLLSAAAPTALVDGLVRQPSLVPGYLRQVPDPGRLAVELLHRQPAELLLGGLPADQAAAVATALAADAPARPWKRWVRASRAAAVWRQSAILAAVRDDAQPWWRRLFGRAEPPSPPEPPLNS